MEIIDGKICISHAELTESIMSSSNLHAMVRRRKVTQIRKGGNGRTAIYDLESLPLKWRVEIYRKYGDPNTSCFSDIKPKESDIIFFSLYQFEAGNKLPVEYVEILAYSCALLEKVSELHQTMEYTWPQLAEKLNKIKKAHTLPKSGRGLQRKVNAYMKLGPSVMISGKFGNKNAEKK